MRTTVTLDPDVEARLREIARERGISFKEALNSAIRAGLMASRGTREYQTPSRSLRTWRTPRSSWILSAADEDARRQRAPVRARRQVHAACGCEGVAGRFP